MTESEAAASTVHDALLESIIDGSLPQGSRLRERELSSAYSVSRVPVREAIQQLHREGFVESAPRRGASVRRLRLEDVDELLDLRLCIEPFAAAEAARRAAQGEPVEPLLEALDAAERAIEVSDTEGVQANTDIHTLVIRMAGNSLLTQWSAPLTDRMRWLFTISHRSTLRDNQEDHEAIVEAIRAGNARLAEHRMAAHIESGRLPIREGLQRLLGEQ